LENILGALNNYNEPNSKYPPYNLVKGPFSYAIQMALAGWRMNELNITVEKNILTVKGDKDYSIKHEDEEYLHKGISERSFIQQFTIGDKVSIEGAELIDGMLFINMAVTVPDDEKKINIPILSPKMIEA
jgi:molecular chaperone IbpA